MHMFLDLYPDPAGGKVGWRENGHGPVVPYHYYLAGWLAAFGFQWVGKSKEVGAI